MNALNTVLTTVFINLILKCNVMDYFDNVLIKLRRQYSKDEVVAALSKKISELEIENGTLKSEIEHLEFELKKYKKTTPNT